MKHFIPQSGANAAKNNVNKLVYRGGGEMSVYPYAYRPPQRIIGTNATETGFTLYVHFQASRHAGSSGKLRPSECAWANRPLKPREPREFWINGQYKYHTFGFHIRPTRLSKKKELNRSALEKIFVVVQKGNIFYMDGAVTTRGKNQYISIKKYGR